MFTKAMPDKPITPLAWTVGETVRLDDGHDWTVQAVTGNFAALTRPVSDRDRAEQAAEYDHPDDDCVSLNDDDEGFCDHISHHSDPEDLGGGYPYYTVIDWRAGFRGPCNLVFGWGGGVDAAGCAAMLAEFEAGDIELSYRRRVPISVRDGRIV